LFKLNVHIEGTGTLWIKEIEIRQATLPADLQRPSNVKADNVDHGGTIKSFSANAKPLTTEGVAADDKGWRIVAPKSRTVRLHDVKDLGVDNCMLTFRANMKSVDVQGKTYLEMLCHLPGMPGEAFSKGLMMPVTGTTEWASYETSFFLKKGERPDLVKLNVVIEGKGTVWVKDIELLRAPLVQ
jgi:hypothetical protein